LHLARLVRTKMMGQPHGTSDLFYFHFKAFAYLLS
jgi:hypothetical protein